MIACGRQTSVSQAIIASVTVIGFHMTLSSSAMADGHL